MEDAVCEKCQTDAEALRARDLERPVITIFECCGDLLQVFNRRREVKILQRCDKVDYGLNFEPNPLRLAIFELDLLVVCKLLPWVLSKHS